MKVVSPVTLSLLAIALSLPCSVRAEDAAPDEVSVVVEALNREIAAIRKKAESDVQAATEKSLAQLQQLQDSLTKAGKLDEALAVRDRILTLRTGGKAPLPDPGDISKYAEQIGSVFYFEVTGATDKTVWGSDIYTYDTPIAAAAVHAGAIKFAEKGVVKVTIMPGKTGFDGSDRNGVLSRTWGSSQASYKVEPVIAAKPVVAKPAAK